MVGGYNFQVNRELEVIRSVMYHPPAHYSLELRSFSSIRNKIGPNGFIESVEFIVGGHTWTLSIYPDGNSRARGCLSLYLNKIIKKPCDGEPLRVSISFFMYDYIRCQFLKIQDSSVSEYNESNHTCGITSAMDTDQFDKASNGFVKGDRCKFGVEVLYHSTRTVYSSLAPVMDGDHGRPHPWVTGTYSAMGSSVYSPAFTRFGRAWKINICPTGYKSAKGKCLSLYLSLVDTTDLKHGAKLFAEYELSLQSIQHDKSVRKSGVGWFSREINIRGFIMFIPLTELRDPRKEFFWRGEALSTSVTIKTVFLLKPT